MTLESYLESIRSKTVAVIGIGISNMPLLELLCHAGIAVTACDRKSREELGKTAEKLQSLGATLQLGEDYLEHLEQDLIFRTPGLMPFDEHLEAARRRGSTVTSEMEVFFSLCPCRIFAVTGSDGKTTTTTIISELLKAAGYTVHLGGNIGKPLLCELPNMQEKDMAVLELSSFQLHSMTCRPHTAVITNISPNHLDKHKDFQDYIDAKRSIFLNQQAEDRLILFADDEHSAYYASQAPSRVSWFSDTRDARPGCLCREGRILWVSEAGEERYIMNADEIRIPGQHNVRNYLAAFEAVRGLVSPELCRETARAFAGVEHRLEEVRYGTKGLICPLMDARRQQVYTGLYEWTRSGEGPEGLPVIAFQEEDGGEAEGPPLEHVAYDVPRRAAREAGVPDRRGRGYGDPFARLCVI